MTETLPPQPAGLQTDWPTEPAGTPPPKRRRLGWLRELPALVIIAFGLAFLIKAFLVQAFYIPSGSMEPTLHGCTQCNNADRVLVNKLALRLREPRRGEIVVFVAQRDDRPRSFVQRIVESFGEGLGIVPPAGERDFIKRVIGLPGDEIEVNERGVFIDPPKGKRFKLKEPYIFSKDVQGPPQEPFTVPPDSYFVMGDNRGNSSDSRSTLGPIARSDIIGKAFFRIWPPSRIGVLDSPGYDRHRRRGRERAAPFAALPALVALVSTAPLRRRGLAGRAR